LEKVKSLVQEAKNDFRLKIKNLISGENGQELEKIREIQEEIIALTEKKQTLSESLNQERLQLAAASAQKNLWQEKKQQAEKELADIKNKLEKAAVKFDATKITEEKRELSKKITALETKISDTQKNDASALLEEKKATAENELHNWLIKESSLNERARLLNNKQQELQGELAEIGLKLEKSQIKFDAGKIKSEEILINKQLEVLNADIKSLSDNLQNLNGAKEKEKAQLFEIQKNVQVVQQEANIIAADLSNLKIEITRQETKLEDLEANIRSNELSVVEIEKHRTLNTEDFDADNLYKKINNAKSQLEQIGGIDPEVEKEYAETKTRFDFLEAQTADLNGAIKSLEEIIAELDGSIKNKFEAEFKVISEKFSEYFKILFSGGSAKISKLTLEESEAANAKSSNVPAKENEENYNSGLTAAEIDIKNEVNDKLKRIRFLKKHNGANLEGIEVQAVPPGKKIQTVTMLSGGERALTAIALICAIISANPSPFVVLDEVDAALDEANSDRLARILDDLSNKTQFIVITHNRASMRRASILYGVTMEADGVSKLLSVKLDDLKK
jgi:chromosome segregation protein